MSLEQAQQMLRNGAASLQDGDAQNARENFERVSAAGLKSAQLSLLLAHACRLIGDLKAEEAALDQLLSMEPRSLRGLIMKGDCRAKQSDDRGATSFYKAAKSVAAGLADVPTDLKLELARVDEWLTLADARYRRHLETALLEAGEGPENRSRRFQQSLEIMFGEKKLYFQQPSAYYFPELPQRQFYDRSEFPWLKDMEAATDDIRAELLMLLRRADDVFRPYLVGRSDRPNQDFHGLLDNPDWSTFYLWANGGPVYDNVALCPKTYEAITRLPLCHITTRAPSVLFSRLKPGSRIPAHTGSLNTRLICHLPLLVPPDCGFRVGNETRQWEEGKTLIFDDTIEHEAWNSSDEDRVVLIFDVWRPELTEGECQAVTAMFKAVDNY